MNVKLMIISMATMIILGAEVLPMGAIAKSDKPEVTAAQIHQGEATVKKIKKRSGKIQLAHGPIKSIGWMSMVMMFDVENKKLLSNIKAGDKVSFQFYATDDGRHVITEIKPLK